MSRPKRGRKYIDKPIQGTLLRRLIAHWVIFVIAFCAVSATLQILLDPLQPIGEKLAECRNNFATFVVVSLVLVPIFVYDSIKLSHRFVGPMVRFRSAVRELADGENPRPVTLRAGDFWQEFATDFNRMMTRFSVESSDDPSPNKKRESSVSEEVPIA